MVSVIWCARQHLKVQIVGLEVWGKNAGGRTSAAITGLRAHCGASVWSAASVPAPLGFTLVGARRSLRPHLWRLSVCWREFCFWQHLSSSLLTVLRGVGPRPDRACAATALRSCVKGGLPSSSWHLATILKCHAVSRTAYIFPEGHSLPATDWWTCQAAHSCTITIVQIQEGDNNTYIS